MAKAKATIDHAEIREWVERVGGCPAHVVSTADGDDPGILRIDFTGYGGQETLDPIDWETWLHWFDHNDLAFLYQDEEESRFNKLVSRASAGIDAPTRKADKAPPTSRFHPIKLLERQHREVEAAFRDYEDASPAERRRVFETIANMLAAHTAIEESLFYPAVFDDETEDELREAVEEHLAVKRIINDLLEMESSDPQFDAKMELMQELVNHHVEEEENELFALVSERHAPDMLELGKRMQEMFERLMQQTPRERVPSEVAHAAPL